MAGRLIVISGLPGTGKTTVARRFAERVRGVHLSIDATEEAMLTCGLPRGWQVGVAAYEAVGAMAEMNLANGMDVIVDAVNDSQDARDTWHRTADRAKSRVSWICLVCSDPAEHRHRLSDRTRGFSNVIEPTWAQVVERGQSSEPWREPRTEIDTARRSVREVVDAITDALSSP